MDTYHHSWECLGSILSSDLTEGILCDIGMPVMHRNVNYNCRVVLLNRKVIGIRPKFYLANDGIYCEMRYFTPWWINPASEGFGDLQQFYLPTIIQKLTGQTKVPIGIFAVASLDTSISFETCEELFTPKSPHIILSLDGVEIMANGSGSHHQLRKLNRRVELLKSATSKAGGVYLYANQKGCDGGRLYYDGSAMVYVNGNCVAQGSQFIGLDEVEVVAATVNLSDVRSFRSNFIARSFQASSTGTIPRIDIDFHLCNRTMRAPAPSPTFQAKLHHPMEEIAYGPSGWLWDYLRRSGMRGYFLALSGGSDSSSTATLVAIMCQRVVQELTTGSQRSKAQVLADIRKITKRPTYTPIDWKDLCGKIFVTCYMASKYSGTETRERAEALAKDIGSMHSLVQIDDLCEAITGTFRTVEFPTGSFSKEQCQTNPQMDGSRAENIALQNIQARSRMVMGYYMAQLMPWATDGEDTTAGGSLLVLGSANVDEAIRGYFTKYDCSAADINPIGGINKSDLRCFLSWAAENKGLPSLQKVASATPSAELTGSEGAQNDEEDMGMSYAELNDLSFCRKVEHCGPLSTFLKLRARWTDGRTITPSIRATGDAAPQTLDEQIAQKVKDFYFFHSVNRHKMTTLTPAYHAENYSPDDNRYDLRPFLQPTSYDHQFAAIDALVADAKY
uniref:Glutamine-dependent NAD(+) synthetase n=1 Tax=Noctiluca scintillans TaxID=2966 RepID=A0A7S0ZSM8_NOCSC